jgi:sugar phosphate isomerase/epimerase
MKIGVEGRHVPDAQKRGPHGVLDFAEEQALDGVFFKTLTDVSPCLDMGELREVKAHAQERGLYFETGIGRINPYNTAESPDVRLLGKGDYLAGMETMVRACREIGCTELWAETATWHGDFPGFFCEDRFRTDVSWPDQLEATAKFLDNLKPVLRECGARVNIETHNEITSFEVVRLVEAIGPEFVGITFDTANVLMRGEHPLAATRRVAPYTHMTHAKDGALYFDKQGLYRCVVPCGEGVIDWETILPLLWEYSPDLNLSIEDYWSPTPVEIFDPAWRALHPDLTVDELCDVMRLAVEYDAKVKQGHGVDRDAYFKIKYEEVRIERLQASVRHLRGIIADKGLHNRTAAAPGPTTAG